MEFRTLDITVMSAKDLNKVNLISKMDVYVIVHIAGGNDKDTQKKKTSVAQDGDTCPSWKFPMRFTIDETAARQNRLSLVFTLRCQRALGDKDIGEVYVPVKEPLDSPASSDGKQLFVSYQVRKPNGKPKGQLTFSYKFSSEKVTSPVPSAKADEPVTAYPAPPMVGPGSSSVYPPPLVYPPPSSAAAAAAAVGGNAPYPPPKDGSYPPAVPVGYPQAAAATGGYPPAPTTAQGAYGYAYPPQQAYGGYPPPTYGGYPPQPQGYGYPPQQMAQPPKKNKFGMGLGAGLLGGALGGLLIGDMISDVGDYGAGYDAGFADGGGFDGGFDF